MAEAATVASNGRIVRKLSRASPGREKLLVPRRLCSSACASHTDRAQPFHEFFLQEPPQFLRAKVGEKSARGSNSGRGKGAVLKCTQSFCSSQQRPTLKTNSLPGSDQSEFYLGLTDGGWEEREGNTQL